MPNNTKAIGASIVALVLVIAAPTVMYFESSVNETYIDVVGIPTLCFGHTGKDVVMGRKASDAECAELLLADMKTAVDGVNRCIHVPLKPNEAAALVSFTYNVGTGALCGSTMARMINSDSPPEVWCHQLMRWDKAKKFGTTITLRGLTKRRAAERDMCLGAENWRETHPRPVDFSNVTKGSVFANLE